MRKLRLTQADKEKLLAEFATHLNECDLGSNRITFEASVKEKAKDKIVVKFTPEAYLKSELLVKNFNGEVGWNGLVTKMNNRTYIVYDILVYPQIVSGARTLDPTVTNDWYEKFDEELEYMHFQAHSHVNFSTEPSCTDRNNQMEIVKNSFGEGYKLFQIWNKAGSINSFLYDLDANILYDKDDIEIEIIDERFGTMKKFLEDAKEMAKSMVQVPAKTTYTNNKTNKYKSKVIYGLKYKRKEPFYWDDFEYYEHFPETRCKLDNTRKVDYNEFSKKLRVL